MRSTMLSESQIAEHSDGSTREVDLTLKLHIVSVKNTSRPTKEPLCVRVQQLRFHCLFIRLVRQKKKRKRPTFQKMTMIFMIQIDIIFFNLVVQRFFLFSGRAGSAMFFDYYKEPRTMTH